MEQTQSIDYRKAEAIVRRLQENGFRAVFAGGCVRDMLLGKVPKDFDIATNATPETVESLFHHTHPVGKSFGVVIVIQNGQKYEVATFRTEDDYTDSRHPDTVKFGTLEEDAERRDFTINGMYWDPISEKLIDRVGGRDDLEKGVIRSIGDPTDRFQEDHIRILRAVRFAARLAFCIEPTTKKALKKTARTITQVAAERVREEVGIILTDLHPANGLRLMDELGILEEVFPELESTKGCEQPENYHPEGDVFVHTILAVEKLGPTPPFTLCMATLLHDIGKPEASRNNPGEFPEHERIGEKITRQICRRLRIPKKETERICWLVKRHMYFKDADKMKKSTLKRLFSEKAFPQLCELARVDAAASWGKYEHIECVLTIREQLLREELLPPPLITGDDLISMGYTPGPAFGKILDSIREKQLDGHIQTKETALKLARELAESFDSLPT